MASRILGAIVDGVGLAAGRDLYDKAKKAIADELGLEPSDPKVAAELEKQRAEAEKQAEKDRAAAEKQAEKDRIAAEKARRVEAVRREKVVDQELAALKRKLGR